MRTVRSLGSDFEKAFGRVDHDPARSVVDEHHDRVHERNERLFPGWGLDRQKPSRRSRFEVSHDSREAAGEVFAPPPDDLMARSRSPRRGGAASSSGT